MYSMCKCSCHFCVRKIVKLFKGEKTNFWIVWKVRFGVHANAINSYTYLECGSIKGEPIEWGACGAGVWRPPGDEPAAAMSGWRKFLLCSSRSWCCARHFVRISGRASSWSLKIKQQIVNFLYIIQTVSRQKKIFPRKRSNKVQWMLKIRQFPLV